jgi:hypothetical protein
MVCVVDSNVVAAAMMVNNEEFRRFALLPTSQHLPSANSLNLAEICQLSQLGRFLPTFDSQYVFPRIPM